MVGLKRINDDPVGCCLHIELRFRLHLACNENENIVSQAYNYDVNTRIYQRYTDTRIPTFQKFFVLVLVLATLEFDQSASASVPERQSAGSSPLSSANQLSSSDDVSTSTTQSSLKSIVLCTWLHYLPPTPQKKFAVPSISKKLLRNKVKFKGRISPFLFLKEKLFELYGIFTVAFIKYKKTLAHY